jgi:hypothetical protein
VRGKGGGTPPRNRLHGANVVGLSSGRALPPAACFATAPPAAFGGLALLASRVSRAKMGAWNSERRAPLLRTELCARANAGGSSRRT